MEFSEKELEELVSMDEINKLLSELKSEETSILRKTPAEIDKIPDQIEREIQKKRLEFLHEVMVWPLLELANRINIRLCNREVEFTGLEVRSIMGRQARVKEFLLSKGCTRDMMLKVVPKTPSEISILETARSQGFSLGFLENQTLDNEDRIQRAKHHLESVRYNYYNSQEYNGPKR